MLRNRHWICFWRKAVSSSFLSRESNQCILSPREHFKSMTSTNHLRSVHCASRYVFSTKRDSLLKKQLKLIRGLPKTHCEFRAFSTEKKLPIIYLFTKDGCTLCDEAKEALRPHMHRFLLEEVDITLPENEQWYELYKYEIPVFHIYEEFLFKHRVDFDALERGLEKYKDGFNSSK